MEDLKMKANTNDKRSEKRVNILVAEDNYVNLKVAMKLLEKKGCRVSSAENGIEVIARLERETYDIILMDIQMPEMDGYETTRIIRDMEKTTGRHIIIIAMTAYAMKGDREKCIATGMDDYIPKPVRVDELYGIIDKYTGGKKPTGDTKFSEYEEEFQKALDNIYGDKELMKELIQILSEDYRRILNEIIDAIKIGNYILAAQKSHSLKGTVGNFGAEGLRKTIAQLEMDIKNNKTSSIYEAFSKTETGLEELVDFLKKWAESDGINSGR